MSRFQDCGVDPAIVERARRGDMKAHEVVYRAYAGAVYTLARRMLQHSETADEVLQDTFVEVIRKIGAYRGEAPIGAWIRIIAVNKCLMHLRSAWHRYARALEPQHEPWDEGAGGDRIAGQARAQLDLEAALAELSPSARAVVWLYDVEGYTHREIGELMGKTTSFSKSQLARAHQRLRRMLETSDESESCMQALNSC